MIFAITIAQNSSLNVINNANDLVQKLVGLGTVVIYLLVALAIIYIVWAIVQYFIKGREGDENRHAATMQIVWGIVGLAIIISLWGLVNVLVNTFYTDANKPTPPNADFINTNNGGGTTVSCGPTNPNCDTNTGD
jgi:heme/copper-type cytochrome/quinol oxidase subunit 2